VPSTEPPRIAVQMYSVRDAGSFEQQLGLVRRCGFEWIETVGTQALDAARFADVVAAHQLRVASMHVGLAVLEADPAEVLRGCALTGCALIVMPWLPVAERSSTAAGWRALGARLAALAPMLAEHGVRLAYHNHDFEFLRYDGQTALEWIFATAAPDVLGWEADLGWLARAGCDPQQWLDRCGARLVAIHAKDLAPDGPRRGEDGWTALGAGIMPWRTLLPAAARLAPLVIFEHDQPLDHADTLVRSRDFLRQHLA
jgi:sugar phosphate isomerase/epimerase